MDIQIPLAKGTSENDLSSSSQFDISFPARVGVVTNKEFDVSFHKMKDINFTYFAQFIIAAILEWKHLLKEEEYKEIIINDLRFLHKEGSIIWERISLCNDL